MPSLPLKYLEMSLVQEKNMRFDLSNSHLSSAEKVSLPPSFTSVGGSTIQEATQGLFRKQSVIAEGKNWDTKLGTNLGPHTYCSEDNFNKTDAAHCNMLSLGFDCLYTQSNDSCVSNSKVGCSIQDDGIQCYRDAHSLMSRRGSFKGFNGDEEMPTESRRNSLLSTVCDASYSQRNENSLHILCASKHLTNNALKKSVKNDVAEDDEHTPSIDADAFDPLQFDGVSLDEDLQSFSSTGTSFKFRIDARVSPNGVKMDKGTQPYTSICDSLILLRDEEKPSIKVRRNSFLSSSGFCATSSKGNGMPLRLSFVSQADKALKNCVKKLLSEDLAESLDSNIWN